MFNILGKMLSSAVGNHAVGANHFQSNKIVTTLSNETGAICRVNSPKDKERYPSLLTGQMFLKKLHYDWDYI